MTKKSQCHHANTEKFNRAEDFDDFELTACSDCGFIIRKEHVYLTDEGEEKRKPVTVKPEDQPASFSFTKDEQNSTPDEGLLTAEDMLNLAETVRDETTGQQARDLAKDALNKCAAKVLDGKLSYLVDEEVSAAVLKAILGELRPRGYRVTTKAEPGKGTWLTIKWATRRTKPRKAKKGTPKVVTPDETLIFTPKASK